MEKYHRNKEIIDGELDNKQIMMHLDNGMYYGLNTIGKRIWDLVEKPLSFDDIIKVLLSEFEVSEEQCTREVAVFLEKALEMEIILKSEMD